MAAATFTRIAQSPYMLRYYVASSDGAEGKRTAAQIVLDATNGSPLQKRMQQLNAAGVNWGSVATSTPASPNPATDPKISVTLTGLTANGGTIASSASYQWYNDTTNNVIGVLGGPAVTQGCGTITAFTNAILEIRLNHSVVR